MSKVLYSPKPINSSPAGVVTVRPTRGLLQGRRGWDRGERGGWKDETGREIEGGRGEGRRREERDEIEGEEREERCRRERRMEG